MKKLFVLYLALMAATSAMQAQARFGLTAGTIFSNYKVKYGDLSISTDSKTGITAGVFLDLPAGKSVSVQPALNYVQKGLKASSDDGGQTSSTKTVIHALELPLNVVYHAGSVFLGAGPALTYSISGKSTYKDGTQETKEDIKFGDSQDDDMHAMDFGANFLAGYSFKGGFQLSAHYYAGFSNLAPGGGDAGKISNSYFGIKLGYLLHH